MKLRVAWRNVKNYVKYDLREIAFPSSLPDPPSVKLNPKPKRKLGLRDYIQILRTSSSLYAKSWTRAGLSDKDWKKAGIEEEDEPESAEKKEPAEPSSVEELALAARAGAEHVRPALQRIYMTRATAYRDALKSFVVGYKEGVAEIIQKQSEGDLGKMKSADGPTSKSSTVNPDEARKEELKLSE